MREETLINILKIQMTNRGFLLLAFIVGALWLVLVVGSLFNGTTILTVALGVLGIGLVAGLVYLHRRVKD